MTAHNGRAKRYLLIMLTTLMFMLIPACMIGPATPQMETEIPQKDTIPDRTNTPTPDPCTGWTCQLEGVLYWDSVESESMAPQMTLILHHGSNCSPTRGEHQVETDANGAFEFEIFFHDTDRIQISIEGEGEILWDSVNRYCYYCSCFHDPLQLVTSPVPTSQP